jgi:hypothetical protein
MSNQKITKLTIYFTDESGEAKVVSYEFPSAVGVENTPSVYLAIKEFFDADFKEKPDGIKQ